MTNFFSNFDVIVSSADELMTSTEDIQVLQDGLGGYLLKINRESDFFREIFGNQTTFTTYERQQIKLFAISGFLKRHGPAREKHLPEAEDASEVDVALARLAEEAVPRGEL